MQNSNFHPDCQEKREKRNFFAGKKRFQRKSYNIMTRI